MLLNRVIVVWAVVLACGAAGADQRVTTSTIEATFSNGALHRLTTSDGHALIDAPAPTDGTAIHRVKGAHWSREESVAGAGARLTGFDGLDGAVVDTAFSVDANSGDIVVEQHATSPESGVWGVEWAVTGIPLDMNILVPGHSGVKLSKTSPGASFTYDYPMAWEAQLVIVEGQGRGFYVWAEDDRGLFKRLTVRRGADGWRLGFATMNYAPFDALTTCDSARWRVNAYEGDWRVPARRYRDWAETYFRPTAVEAQQPEWVDDMRCCVIMGLDTTIIEQLAKRLDPKQTMLYIPSWRAAGYDRDYPSYNAFVDGLLPFMDRAHELGYRVMLHVNYFGVDPLNPLYEQFEPYQVRSPWGTHEKEWWLWTRADPVIKFAYINPACKAWRDVFVERMAALRAATGVDALHLDQTLCIFNDHNGLIDGMTMIEGNIALHKALREALPEVAISGEGLNEITHRYEAFAQRHAWGVHHSEGTWSRAHLACAHPISSYLLRPYTIIYGYLGCAPPQNEQLYAAWNEAYQHWGVIPTLKPRNYERAPLSGFERQFFDEAAFWQRAQPCIDMDGEWPDDAVFPYRCASGETAYRTRDRRLVHGDTVISRTVTDVTDLQAPGTVPGWLLYDKDGYFGLNADTWYPYFKTLRDPSAFHVAQLPEGFTLALAHESETMACVRVRQSGGIVADLAAEIDRAVTGSAPFSGEPTVQTGALQAEDGGAFSSSGSMLHAHPPWKGGGSGTAYATYRVRIPDQGTTQFITEVALDPTAASRKKSDGVTFSVTVRMGETESRVEVHTAKERHEELVIDLSPFNGSEIELELRIHPGPDHSPTYDWARWYAPRVEHDLATRGPVTVVSQRDWSYALTDTYAGPVSMAQSAVTVDMAVPGGVFLLPEPPPLAELPFSLVDAPRTVTFVNNAGRVLNAPAHACAVPHEGTVGGIARPGLFTHPPNQGRTVIDIPMTLPEKKAEFHTFVGVRDGSESEGVVFAVEVNGVERSALDVLSGEWNEISYDLSPWRGRSVVVSLIADSDGSYECDWAHWGEPVIRPKP